LKEISIWNTTTPVPSLESHAWQGGETLVLSLSKGKLDRVDYNRDFNLLSGFQFSPIN
jgi:hypothetical protein